MKDGVTKAELTPARRRLVELMQDVRYGRIEGLRIEDGEPVLAPPPTVVRLYLFGRANTPAEARGSGNFLLKWKVTELFEAFDRERSFSIQELMIDDGLPVRMTVAEGVKA